MEVESPVADGSGGGVAEVGRLSVLPGATRTCVTCVMDEEDHTIGNLLRYMLMKNAAVEFASYTVPHPSERRIHVRIQTSEPHAALDVLREALHAIIGVCDQVRATFETSTATFEAATDHGEAAIEF